MEDRRFYSNEGISVSGLMRAAINNYRAGHVVAGGSTITQQTAKIVFLSPERTYARKYEELLDAAALQKSLTKAADPRTLSEPHLSGLRRLWRRRRRPCLFWQVGAQSVRSRKPRCWRRSRARPPSFRRAGILKPHKARVEHGSGRPWSRRALSRKSQADEARANPAVVVDRTAADERNYFLDTAADEALGHVDAVRHRSTSDLIVHTTLLPRLDDAARKAVAEDLEREGQKSMRAKRPSS